MKLALPQLFSAFAVAAGGDADLPDGLHLRLALSPDIGPPLAPFAIWRTDLHPSTILQGTGTIAIPGSGAAIDGQRIVAVAAADPSNLAATLVLADPVGGEIARRAAAPCQLAAPVVQAVRVDGGSAATQVGLFTVAAEGFANFVNVRPTALLPLPIAGACAWYAGGTDASQALARVQRGAPRRYTPVDQPAGPLAALAPAAELARVQGKTEIDSRLELLLRQGTQPPATRTTTVASPEPNAPSAELALWDTLLLQTADIGYARYAGLATTFDLPAPLPPLASVGRTILPGFWIAGLFATPADALTLTIPNPAGGAPLVLVKYPQPVDPAEQQLLTGFRNIVPGLDAVLKRAADAGLQVRPLLTFCAAPVPADPPRAGTVILAESKWIAQPKAPSTSFRQNFLFADQPLAATMAMSASFGGGTFLPRTPPIDGLPGRFHPLLAARLDTGQVAASDTNIPIAPAPALYHFHAGDLFGRYGGASTVAVKPPAIPKPPKPVPQYVVTRIAPAPGATGALSPGALNVVVPVPEIGALAAGARPIKTVERVFAGQTALMPATLPQTAFAIPLPALQPLATGTWEVRVRFRDDAGTASDDAVYQLTVTDARAPQPIKAGPGIVWTSRPGPAPEVELNLRWPAAPGQLFRAYLASAGSLGVAGTTRAAIGFAGAADKITGKRAAFQLLSDPPVTAGGDGFAHLSATLPRALAGVSFFRIVALSPQGVEADFDASGVVPVAVPRDFPPPAPRVSGMVAASGTAVSLTIEATGLDLVALQAAEPGLFATPPDPQAKPPMVRLRRASGPVDDPLYARMVGGAVPLIRQADGRFLATIADSPLPPFVRCTWWAEVRLPDERRLPPGVSPSAGGIVAEPGAPADMPGLSSRLSAPFSTVPAPPGPPAPLAPGAIQAKLVAQPGPITTTVATLTIPAPPFALPGAIGPWRLRVWYQRAAFALDLLSDAPTAGVPFTWSSTAMLLGGDAITFYVAVVDPLGRESAPTKVIATP